MALPEGDQSNHVGKKKGLVAHQVAHKTRELAETVKPSKTKNPVKTNVLRGSADGFTPLRERKMGAEGLEPNAQNAKETMISEILGPTSGPVDYFAAPLMVQALEDLQRAWKSIRRMETLSDDRAEAKSAERALAFVDKAFSELEGGGR